MAAVWVCGARKLKWKLKAICWKDSTSELMPGQDICLLLSFTVPS